MSGVTLFTGIAVVPVTRVHQHVAQGGPIWPGFEWQTWVRHCRDGKPRDVKPDLPERLMPFDRPAVWGGFLDSHFGHFVADHVPRLLVSLRERPADMFLFTVDPGVTREGLAPWVWQVFDWIGLPRAQVHLVTEPLFVDVLHVAPQAEMLAQEGPSPEYLEEMAGWARHLEPVPAPLLYVGRLGFAQKAGGAHAGERYLVEMLRRLDVAVLDPGTAPVPEQMAAYAGAARLVFAEGSALHGRQLLGHVAQEIDVLRRRPGKAMARAALQPRCRRLTYHDVNAAQLMAYWKSGKARPDPALALYDVAALHRVFAGFGVDIAAAWDQAAYEAAARADAQAWIDAEGPRPGRLKEYRAVLAELFNSP